MKKRLVQILGLFAAAAAAILVGAYVALTGSLPASDGETGLAGLRAPVSVTRDAAGVPTLRGSSRLDVARATGFVHAQERYFQMDLLRRVAAGELSALFGPAALDADQRLRLHGLRRMAARVVAALPDTQADILAAYVQGANAGLAALDVRPPEYLLLRSEPLRWRAEDSVLAALAMFIRLSDPDAAADARRGALQECLPPSAAAFLFGDDPDWIAPLDGGTLPRVPMPTAHEFDLRQAQYPEQELRRTFAESAAADTELPLGASNAWAVAGSLTDDGRALVANDMHLGLAAPNIWYRARLVVADPAAPLRVQLPEDLAAPIGTRL